MSLSYRNQPIDLRGTGFYMIGKLVVKGFLVLFNHDDEMLVNYYFCLKVQIRYLKTTVKK